MSSIWDQYVANFGKVPETAHQLMNYSKKSSTPLNFADARKIFDERSKGKGKGSAAAPAAAASGPAKPAPSNKGGGGGNGAAAKGGPPKAAPKKEEAKEDEGGNSGLFAELNQGLGVTSNLKKVTPDMKSKNRKDKSGKVPAEVPKKANAQAQAAKPAAPAKKQSSLKKQGLRWLAEYYTEGVTDVEEADVKCDVFITSCNNCGFRVPNKVKNVTLDNCKKVQVEVTEVVSSVELVNCADVTVYIKVSAPSITLDKCQGPKVYLFRAALEKRPNIITSMVADLNLELQPENEEADWVEVAVPYQFQTHIDPDLMQAKTEPVSHMG